MAKALKTAALIVGAVALVATGVGAVALGGLAGTLTVAGISTSTLFLVSGGLTVAASLLQKTPKVTAAQTERLTASIDPRAFRKTVLGQTACPVEIRYEEWSGKDQEYCDWIALHASHAMDGIEEIWFDTEMAWSATTGVVGKWNGYFWPLRTILEGSPANAFTFGSGRWNAASARLTGCAYSHWRFKVTGNGKKAESPFSGGLPSRITVIGRGAKLYDPRRDSTVPGGNGPMRADDQLTWRYTTDDGVTIGENLPLQILRVVLGWRIRNPSTGELKLATGSGVPARRLNLATFIDAANLADELVNRSAGGTEPRYHGAGVISEGDDPKASLDMLCTGCCGRFRDTGGKLSLVIAHNDLASAAIDDGLTDHDVVGAFTWDPDAALEATPNVVRGKYVDASANSLYQLIDYPEVRLPSPDGQDRFFPLDLGVVESPSQAQRIAKMVLQRKQYPREFSAPFDIRAWKYSVGDVVPFTFAALGFNRRIFRVKDQELGQGGVCNMTLTVETPALYAWDKDDVAPVQAADVIVYDSRNNPLILAIADAGTTANWDGVTGAGRPADNATNSADPTSPFGPDGTVGGTVKQLSDFDAAIAAARKYQDALDSDTIPAINKAVADAGDRITATRKAADDGLAAADRKLLELDGTTNRRIDSLIAEGGYDDTGVRAEIKRVDEAAIYRDGAISRQIDTITASVTGAGGNLLSNSDFLPNTEGWAFVSESGTVTALNGFSPANYYPPRVNTLIMYQPNSSASRAGFWYEDVTGVEGSAIYQASAYLASHRCTSQVYVDCYNPAGSNVGTFAVTASEGNAGNQQISDFRRVYVNFTAPPGTSFVRFHIIKNGTRDGLGDSYVWFFRPQFTRIGSMDSPAVPYSSGGAGAPLVSADAKITQAATVAARADQAVGNLSTSVDTRFGGVNDTLGRYGSSITALSDADKGFADRATSLEASARATDTALNGAGGVQARLTSYGATLADFPNRYAAVSRAEKLEAQLNGEDGSRLLSRAENTATALVDNLNGAVNGRMDIMVSEYNGIGATVKTQAGTLAGVDGRTSVYWEVQGTTGDGKTRVRLSKSNGERGVFYVDADMVVDGNLLVAGSVTTKTIAANNITQPLSAQTTTVKQISWQDANPNYGVEVTVANPIGAPIRIDFRYSQQGGGQGGQPPFTVQIQRVSPNGDTYNFSDASYIGGIILDTSPPAGAYVTYRFYFKHQYASGQGTTNVIYQQLFALEMRR